MLNFRKLFGFFSTPEQVVGSPLAETIPDSWKPTAAPSFEDFNGNADDYASPKTEVKVVVDAPQMSDEKVLAALGTLRAQSVTRLAPNQARVVQHGTNMQQVRKNKAPIFATGGTTGEDLLKLMR